MDMGQKSRAVRTGFEGRTIRYGDAVSRTAARAVLIGLTVTVWIAAYGVFGFRPTRVYGDAWNYLAAGERLNAGHPLYALSPGDRAIELIPPYWSVPLLSPPPIAVAWRPLAPLGDLAMVLWALACLATTLVGQAILLVKGNLRVALAATVLAAPLAIQGLSGNVNGLFFGALLAAWFLRDRPLLVGSVVALGAAVKLTPALLAIWLVKARRWRALAATVAAGAVIGLVSLLGAGIDNHIDWLRSVPTSQPAPGSLATFFGVSPLVVLVALTAIAILVARLGDERWAFAAAILATTLSSPALYLGHLGLAAAALAPWLTTEGLAVRGPLVDRRRQPAVP
jgi:hypothetical protein